MVVPHDNSMFKIQNIILSCITLIMQNIIL